MRLRLYDVTDVDLTTKRPQSFQEFAIAEETLNYTAPIQPNRDYLAEIGYLTGDRRWLALARSNQVRVTAPTIPATAAARSQITLTARPEYKAYARWQTPDDHKVELRHQGGRNLVLRLYDVTDLDLSQSHSQNFQDFSVAETASTYTADVQPDRDYIAEIGYVTGDHYWLSLARSNAIRIPSVAAGAAGVGAAIGTGLAAVPDNQEQVNVEAAKHDVGQSDLSSESLASVDEGLPDLPDGYGESRIVLMPRDPQWGYAYWDAPNEQKEELRRQGGQRLALRLYDVTGVELNHQSAHSLQQYDCEEMARDWYIPIPVSDRDYIAEIGYVTGDGGGFCWRDRTRFAFRLSIRLNGLKTTLSLSAGMMICAAAHSWSYCLLPSRPPRLIALFMSRSLACAICRSLASSGFPLRLHAARYRIRTADAITSN
jgi:hypothetical protein